MTGAPLLLVSGDFVRTGGMDAANHALASYAAREGRELHLVAHRVADDLLANGNVTFHSVPKPGGSYFLGAPLLDHIGRHWARAISARGGRVVVNGGNCLWGDANWVHYVHASYAPTVHGSFARRVRARVARHRALVEERVALRRARIIIANSHRTSGDVVQLLGLSAARVHPLYYGIDPSAFTPADERERAAARSRLGWSTGRPVVAFVGALGDRRKGFDALFAAWELLCADQHWDGQLVVVGTGGELDDWRQRARARGMEGRIEFLGFRSDVPEILAACDALVHPARYEAYGLAVQEALARGLPAFVSARAGVAERYPSDLRSLLIPDPDDISDLAARLTHWRRNVESVRARVLPFANDIRARTWDVMAAEFLDLIERDADVPAARGRYADVPTR